MKAKEFLKSKGINRATCYTDGDTYYINDLAKLLNEYAEQQVKNLTMHSVINRRELLIDFCSSVECYQINTDQVELADGVDKYLKSINSL